jgi:hypothetical protein
MPPWQSPSWLVILTNILMNYYFDVVLLVNSYFDFVLLVNSYFDVVLLMKMGIQYWNDTERGHR